MQPIKEFDCADFSKVCEFLKLANGIDESASVASASAWYPYDGRGTEERV